ncbi:MAG: type II secretion system F family protein [Actinobacteria bacterium]|nr:type II secretion system F family protein [Actinomycetota bacterium]
MIPWKGAGSGPMTSAVLAATLCVGLGVAWGWAVRGERRIAAIRRADPARGDGGGSVPRWFDGLVHRAGLPVDAVALWSVARPLAVVLAGALAVAQPVLLVVALAGGGVITARARAVSRRPPVVDPVAVVEALVAPLGAGASLAQAVDAACERAPGSAAGAALAPVLRSIDEGRAAQAAFDRWVAGRGDPNLVLVADALAVAGTSGGSRAHALISVSRTIREREALAREVRALGSQSRTSAVVLSVVPVAFTGVVAVVDTRVAAFLFSTPAGVACLGSGLVADAFGWWWMRRLVGAVS